MNNNNNNNNNNDTPDIAPHSIASSLDNHGETQTHIAGDALQPQGQPTQPTQNHSKTINNKLPKSLFNAIDRVKFSILHPRSIECPICMLPYQRNNPFKRAQTPPIVLQSISTPTTKPTNGSRSQSQTSTALILTKSYANSQAVRTKACGHIFCYGCIRQWTRTKQTCPLCRSVIYKKAGQKVVKREEGPLQMVAQQIEGEAELVGVFEAEATRLAAAIAERPSAVREHAASI